MADRKLAPTGVHVRPINMKDFHGEVERIWDVYNSAWERNWGFIPMTREEFFLMGKEMKQILKPDLVLIGEKDGRVVGFALALPDVNQALKPAGGSLFPDGAAQNSVSSTVDQESAGYRIGGSGGVSRLRDRGGFLRHAWCAMQEDWDIGDCEMSWILEDNVLMNRSLEAMGAKRYKTYRIYDWN